jgi:hypothetical protein
MARSPFFIEVKDSAGNVVTGASVTVRSRATGIITTVYQGETGGTTLSNPMTVDVNGRAIGFVDRGDYNAVVAGTGIVSYTVPIDAAPAGDREIDTMWWPAQFTPTIITSGALPVSAGDGDRVIWAPSSPAMISPVELRYRAAASTYKWEAIGGNGFADTLTSQVTRAITAATWTDSTAGWSAGNATAFTVPFSGEYDVWMSGSYMNASNAAHIYLGPSINAAVPLMFTVATTALAGYWISMAGCWRLTLTAGAVVRPYIYSSGGATSPNFLRNTGSTLITPVRVI